MTTNQPIQTELNAADDLARTMLRKHFRSTRRDLTAEQRVHAEQAIIQAVLTLIDERGAKTIGAYFPNDGEPDLTPLLHHIDNDQRFAVPVLHQFDRNHLVFLQTDHNTPLRANKYGIPEPPYEAKRIIPLQDIDLLFVPLVAFDAVGNRLGMGGGFYDRTLAPWLRGELPHLLPVGIAFDEQQADTLPHAPWDVPLPRIITPSKSWQFSSRDV